jgi:hypothetical protein
MRHAVCPAEQTNVMPLPRRAYFICTCPRIPSCPRYRWGQSNATCAMPGGADERRAATTSCLFPLLNNTGTVAGYHARATTPSHHMPVSASPLLRTSPLFHSTVTTMRASRSSGMREQPTMHAPDPSRSLLLGSSSSSDSSSSAAAAATAAAAQQQQRSSSSGSSSSVN